jgi:hypothetical protein
MSAVRVRAIDPGTTESAFVFINADTRRPQLIGKAPNVALRERLRTIADFPVFDLHVAIEMVASYGMAVGREVFETCVWIGRFAENAPRPDDVELVYRLDVKKHHCHTGKNVHDANVAQALIDRFASGQPNRGKGTKANPGWFYGFKADIWQAYALAVYVADRAAA